MGFTWKWLLYNKTRTYYDKDGVEVPPYAVMRSSSDSYTTREDCIETAMDMAIIIPNQCERILEISDDNTENLPLFKDYITLKSRLSSLEASGQMCGETAKSLANAGFFYSEKMGHIACFYCSEQTNHQGGNESIAILHRQLSPECPYLPMCVT